MTVQDSLQAQIYELLDGGSFRGEGELNRLFTQMLGYKFIPRGSQHVVWTNWSEPAREGMNDPPRKLFQAGIGDDFSIVYCKLKGNRLLVGQERRAISQLQSKNNIERGLFIFSTEDQSRWHFVNVRYEGNEKRRPLQRRITVGPEERHRTASERIAKLALEGNEVADLSDLEIQNRHNEAFDVEQVTKKFFEDYQKVYFDLQDDLIEQTNDLRWAHDYSLQFINRMMFLYFIQRKRWLGNDPGFVRKFWNAYRLSDRPQDTFFADWLQSLFFEAFNGRFHGGRSYFPKEIRDVLALAPFLNGGLFSENELDEKYGFEISDQRFETVFDLLEQYNFTISEDSPLDQEVAVDPEMIGKVYESLVNVEETAADERSAAGIFYTPRTEIDLMCRLTVVDHLANHLGEERRNLLYEVVFAIEPEDKDDADRQVDEEGLWTELDERLRSITSVDPACGSGSFLVGMLQVLDDLLQRSARQLGRDEDPYERRKRIIGQSLYGVDVMDWAVRVAELRLWLSLILDTDFTCNELHLREEPLLPHFTFKLRPGDGLVQEVGGVNLGHMRSGLSLPSAMKRKITTLKIEKLKFYNNDPERKFRTAEGLHQEECRLFIEILDTRSREIQKRIADLNHRIDNPTEELQLDGMADSNAQSDLQTIALQKEVDDLEEERTRLALARQAIRPDKPVPFVWDIAFVEIFEGDDRGFDIVVGNPPYVRQEQIADPRLSPEEVTAVNKKEYKAKLARSVYHIYSDFFRYNFAEDRSTRKLGGMCDLYIYFYFHGLSLLNSNGSFCFITSNSWLDVGYGKDLQEFLLRHCHIKMVLDNTKRSFASADVNTVITLFSPPNEAQDTASQKLARFVMFTVPFEHILDPVIFEEIEDWNDRTTTQEYKIHPISQQALLEDGAEVIVEANNENVLDNSNTRINLDNYTGNKWGGKYLRAPDIYWRIVDRAANRLVRLGNVADEVRRGFTSGANDFFFVQLLNTDRNLALIRCNDGSEHHIEAEYVKEPVVVKAREIIRPRIEPEEITHRVVRLNASSQEKPYAAAYIRWGETQGFHRRPTTRNRSLWFESETREFAQAFVPIGHKRRPVVAFSPDAMASDNLVEVRATNKTLGKILTGCILGSYTLLLYEIIGRANFGQGLLKTQTYEIANLLVLNPQTVKPDHLNKFEETFDTLADRVPLMIYDDIRCEDRVALDDAFLLAIGFNDGHERAEAVAELHDATCRMIWGRMAKSDNSRETRLTYDEWLSSGEPFDSNAE